MSVTMSDSTADHAHQNKKLRTYFTEYDMSRLGDVYKEYDCLWNMKHELYRDNEARQVAYREIAEKLNIPNLLEKHIPNKIKNLRSSYYQEIKRIRRSARANMTYVPKVVWFDTVDSFLRPFRHERDFMSKSPTNGIENINVSAHRNDSDQIQKESPSTMEDEFDSFGKYIASSLRSLPKEFSIIAKTELQKVISDIQLNLVRQVNARTTRNHQTLLGSESTLRDIENRIRCISPTESCISTIKVEYDS